MNNDIRDKAAKILASAVPCSDEPASASTRFGVRLREERKRAGWASRTTAELLGIPTAVWNRYEKGLEHPPFEILSRFCLLGADAHYLLTGQRLANVSGRGQQIIFGGSGNVQIGGGYFR